MIYLYYTLGYLALGAILWVLDTRYGETREEDLVFHFIVLEIAWPLCLVLALGVFLVEGAQSAGSKLLEGLEGALLHISRKIKREPEPDPSTLEGEYFSR